MEPAPLPRWRLTRTRYDQMIEAGIFGVLLVEVAETSLALDRTRRGALYARAGLDDYWVVNLRAQVLEIYREPVMVADDEWRYNSVRLLRHNATVTPLAAPRARIRVATLLP